MVRCAIRGVVPGQKPAPSRLPTSPPAPDIKASFERFFELNPGATGYYHNYALYAYRAEQWDKLNELLPKLEPVNYSFFGGKEEFDKMVQIAREHSAGTNSQNK